MKSKRFLLLGLCLLLLCFGYISIVGREYTVKIRPYSSTAQSAEEFQVELDHTDTVSLIGKEWNDGVLSLTFRSLQRGKEYVSIKGPDEYSLLFSLYVHTAGIITYSTFFGDCTGSHVLPIVTSLYLALLFYRVAQKWKSSLEENYYQYINVTRLGLLIYLGSMLLNELLQSVHYGGLIRTVRSFLSSAEFFALLTLPALFFLTILMAVSNFNLMRREGVNWRNMLGFLLGILLCLGTLTPVLLSEYLQRTTLVDVHNERGAALYVEMLIENTAFVIISYLECILAGTVILGYRAAKNIPEFDRDYILILGCQIKKDGTLTPLLQGRADRALEFAEMQKRSTGKDVIFVPSGGQGPDEVVAEADALRNYLVGVGVDEDKILVENRSTSTQENFQYSIQLIREKSAVPDPKIAFSTTNYHVFRSGCFATKLGCRAEGVGSKTKSYFWINAFIREFFAALSSERKIHLRAMRALVILTVIMVGCIYLSNIL